MIHCFVHAPCGKGWNGELLMHLEKDCGQFKQHLVRKEFESWFPEFDFDEMVYDPSPTTDQITAYLLRRENGMMQRMSAFRTYEDCEWKVWIKGLEKHSPSRARQFKFMRSHITILYHEAPTQKIGGEDD